ncbi:MAG: hypothetical protein Q9225_005035 [Loekoesia sp. 1 TL-2023]
MEVIGGVSGVVAIVGCVAKVAKKLNEIKDSYDAVALNIQLAAIQLATIRDALEAIAEWRLGAQAETQASRNLDATLAESLKGCAVLITVIDSKLGEAGYAPGVKRKIRHMWLEDVLKGYMSNLDGQVRALQLLLTSFQCRTVTEQIQRLQRAEAQSVFEQVRADTASLTVGNKDLADTASILSYDPSVNFEMDDILMRHPAYIAAYGNRRPPLPKRLSEARSPSIASIPMRAQAPVAESPVIEQPDRLTGHLKSQEELHEPTTPTAQDQTPQEAADQLQRPKAQEPDRSKKDDPALVSAVAALNHELQSAFDNAPPLEQPSEGEASIYGGSVQVENQGPDVQTNGAQSDEETSDIDEMITLLPLASHFNISRKSEDSRRPPQRLSAGSRSQETRRHETRDSRSISSLKSKDPIPVEVPEPVPQTHDHEAVILPAATTEGSESLRAKPVRHGSRPSSVSYKSPSVRSNKSPSLQGSPRRLSTDSDLYASSITERRPEKMLPPKTPSSTDSDPYTSSIVEKQQSSATLSEGDAEENETNTLTEVRPFPHTSANEQAVQNGFPTQPHRANRDSTSKDRADQLISGPIDGNPDPPTPPQTVPSTPSQPQQSPKPAESPLSPNVQTTGTGSIEAEDQNRLNTFRNSAHSLRRSELVSSDYVKYSNAEQHGLKIILTPESGVKPRSQVVPSFAAPPSRPPPSVPQTSLNSASTLSPANSLNLGRRPSDESAQSRYTMAGALTSSPVEREESINETISTVSSSDRSDRQTLSSHMTNASNTTATSFSHPPDSLRGQAQNDLHKLQLELAAAKSRGDTSAQKASLQRSMDIIQKTYLNASPTRGVESGPKQGSPPKSKGSRISLMPKKSMSLLSMVGKKSRQTDLHEAARTGDLDSLRSLLEEKVIVNARGDRLKTPQMEAAMRSHLHCLETLKEFGADEFAVDGQGRTVLHMAVMSNQPKAVSWLIQAYPPAAPDIPGKKSSRIAWATEAITGSRSSKILREASDGQGSRPLHVAAKLALPDMVSLLLDNGSEIDAKDNWGRTSLADAASLNRLNIVELLLDRGADIAAKDVSGMTALHWAAKNNHLGVIRVLLAKGDAGFANPNSAKQWFDNHGDLPIHSAAREGHVEPVKLLRAGRPLSEINTKHGETLIHITALANHLPLAKELLRDNIDVNAWAKPQSYHLRLWPGSESGYSPKALPLPYNIIALHYACTRGYYEMTELLLENGAWVNAAPDDDEHGKSPLMMAVESGDTNLVCLLLARGAKVNAAVPATLMTALHLACKQGDLETAQELIRYGAKTASRTRDLRTPEELVAKIKDTKKRLAMQAYFAELTRQRYAKIKAQMAEDRRPGAQPSLTPQPSPVVQAAHGQFQPHQGAPNFPVEFMDPENDAFPDAPPAYTPGPNAPRNLANRPGVYRPQYG